jgi:glycosyltransferase involved in cell wall biosynthesis
LIWGKPIFDNVSFLLECFGHAAQECRNMELLIVAGGDWLPQTKDLIARKYSGLRIRIREWVKPAEMPEILRQADIGLLPLIQTEPWFQAKSPTKLYEYLASGLSVVASPTGEASHIVQPGISGMTAPDKESFTQALAEICRDAELRSRLSKGARARAVKRYSLEVLGGRLEHALEGVLLP